ncbi:MAG: hypothetical protein ACKOYC_09960 [Bacteroidota bacterium]
MKSYALEINVMVKQLLLSTLGTLRFVMYHEGHPLAVAIRQLELADAKGVGALYDRLRKSDEGERISMTLDEEILIYTSMDITCKAYMTDLGDELRSLNEPGIKKGDPRFGEIRSTILRGCEIVMDGMRQSFSDEPEFEERVDVLEQFVIV